MSVILPETRADAAGFGGKAGALFALRRGDFPVPAWFVVTPPAAAPDVPDALLRDVLAALERLCPDGRPVAVRSSGADEDGAGHSFAGQFDSVLGVNPRDADAVRRALTQVWASGSSERVRAYRAEHGLAGDPRPPAALVQRMVHPRAAGVAFSADPVSGRRGVCLVSGVPGLGSALVSGDADADTWRVDRAGTILDRAVAKKRCADRPGPSGVESVALSAAEAEAPCLTDAEVREVAVLARRAAAFFGRAQDIEWALEDGRLFLLQSRPVTSLGRLADPDGARRIWDNSNIAESYSGVTTPLTFTFARRAYEEVYRQFCLILGVSDARVRDHADVFSNMIGLVRGRTYYNLASWYRVLALLPGFTVNRRFMEQMMGVKEGIPDDLLALPDQPRAAWRDRLDLIRSALGLVRRHLTIGRDIRAFYVRLGEALAPPAPPLEEQRLDQLAAGYRDLERRLLTRWDAPLVNDFLAMIFFGVLRSVSAKWLNADEALHNDLVSGAGDIVSAEPARRVRALAGAVRGDAALVDLLRAGPADTALAALRAHPVAGPQLAAYLEKFADRCLQELKLESATLADDPLPLLRSIGHFARRLNDHNAVACEAPAEPKPNQAGGTQTHPADWSATLPRSTSHPRANVLRGSVGPPAPNVSAGDVARARAEKIAAERLAGRPLRGMLFRWILRHARDRVSNRENLRFERTRLFGRVRRVFLEMGRRLAESGRLDDPRDVFWLEAPELLGFCEGTLTAPDLRGLVALRRGMFADYERDGAAAPGNRFETRGAVHDGNAFTAPPASAPAATGEVRRGLGCCPGLVRGVARVITDPRGAELRPGEILVARQTDPGWILLFPAASGILVEQGSLLSHSAIVAREMGIPAVVGLEGLTGWLASGDTVEFNGATGEVRRVMETA